MTMPNLISIDNGERVRHSFSDGEYANRIAKLGALLGGRNRGNGFLNSFHNNK
jgi:creatinase